jgi:hypothetical protein
MWDLLLDERASSMIAPHGRYSTDSATASARSLRLTRRAHGTIVAHRTASTVPVDLRGETHMVMYAVTGLVDSPKARSER